jgi:transposase
MYLKVLTQKNSDGHVRKYLQLVESRRVNGSPRQVVLASLGRFDTEEGEQKLQKLAASFIEASSRLQLLNLAEDLKALSTREFGPALIFKRLWEDLGLGKVMKRELRSVTAEFDVEQALFNMVLNRLSDPSSKRQLLLWEQEIEGIPGFDLHQYYRALDYAIEYKEGIEKGIFEQMRDLFHQSVDVVLFDTTSLVYYGDSEKHEELLARGFSKAHRGDLKQIVVGVLMSKQGIPLGHEVFEGNKNDVTCFRQMLEKISSRFQIGQVIIVGDRGMISKENLEYLEKKGYSYILGYRMRTIPKRFRSRIFEKASFRKLKNLELEFSEQTYEGQRLVVCYSAERAEKDQKHRQDVLERIEKKIAQGNIQALIDNASYKRFLKIRGDKPKLDPEKVSQDACYDGIFVLTTNTPLSSVQVVQSYKDLWQVELAFRQLKSELEMGPIFHWKDRRIRAHILICFLAFVLRTALYKKLQEKNKEVSYTQTLQDLQALRSVELDVAGKKVKLRTELRAGAVQAFEAVGMRAPSRFLSSEIPSPVVVRH